MFCKYCNKEKPSNQFESFRTNKKTYLRKKCKRCKQDTQNGRRSNIRDWFYEYKKSLICLSCGNPDYRVLEFHHLYGKDANVSEMMTYSKTRILNEIKKCVVLCANCHRIEHYNMHKNPTFATV